MENVCDVWEKYEYRVIQPTMSHLTRLTQLKNQMLGPYRALRNFSSPLI